MELISRKYLGISRIYSGLWIAYIKIKHELYYSFILVNHEVRIWSVLLWYLGGITLNVYWENLRNKASGKSLEVQVEDSASDENLWYAVEMESDRMIIQRSEVNG